MPCSTCHINQAPLKSAKTRSRLAALCTVNINCEYPILFSPRRQNPRLSEAWQKVTDGDRKCQLFPQNKYPEYDETQMLKQRSFIHCIPPILTHIFAQKASSLSIFSSGVQICLSFFFVPAGLHSGMIAREKSFYGYVCLFFTLLTLKYMRKNHFKVLLGSCSNVFDLKYFSFYIFIN